MDDLEFIIVNCILIGLAILIASLFFTNKK